MILPRDDINKKVGNENVINAMKPIKPWTPPTNKFLVNYAYEDISHYKF